MEKTPLFAIDEPPTEDYYTPPPKVRTPTTKVAVDTQRSLADFFSGVKPTSDTSQFEQFVEDALAVFPPGAVLSIDRPGQPLRDPVTEALPLIDVVEQGRAFRVVEATYTRLAQLCVIGRRTLRLKHTDGTWLVPEFYGRRALAGDLPRPTTLDDRWL